MEMWEKMDDYDVEEEGGRGKLQGGELSVQTEQIREWSDTEENDI